MQPRARLAFWAVSACCLLISDFSSTNFPKSFSSGLLSIHSSPSCTGTEDCPDPCAEPWQFALLNLMTLIRALSPSLQGPSGWHPFPEEYQYLITQLGITSKLAEGALNPTISLIKILNSTCPSKDP